MKNMVRQKFNTYPKNIRTKMQILRNLIYEVAENTEGVGELEETLKWNEPAYLTSKTKSGTAIRIDWKLKNPDRIGMYLNCKTTLVSTWRIMFQDDLEFEGNRAILISVNTPIPKDKLLICIKMALRYHLDKEKA